MFYTPISEDEGEQLILVLEYKDGERLSIAGYNNGEYFRNLETRDELDNVILYKLLPNPPQK